MKMIIAFAALVAVASAASVSVLSKKDQYPEQGVVVLKEQIHDNNGLGGYKYSYELSDGQTRNEVADIVSVRDPRSGEENVFYKVSGSFSFVNPQDGQTYTVTYVADENGFQPQGAHLPTV